MLLFLSGGWAYAQTNHTPTVAVSGLPLLYSTGPLTTKTITVTYHDDDGSTDLKTARLLINTNGTYWAKHALCAKYDAVANKLYLRDAQDTTWQGGVTPGSSATLTSSLGALDCAATTVTRSGNDLSVAWNVTPSAALDGTNGIYAYAEDQSGAQTANPSPTYGSWTISGQSPTIVAQSPIIALNTGTGQERTITTTYRDVDGALSLRNLWLLVNTSTTTSRVNAVSCFYDARTNLLYLQDDVATGLVTGTGYAPGTNIVLSNRQGSLNVKDTTVTYAGSDFTIDWKISLKTPLAGGNGVWAYSQDRAGRNSGAYAGTGYTWQLSSTAPMTLTGTPSTAQTNLSWTSVSGATGYNVLRSISSGGPYTPLNSTPLLPTTTNYTDRSPSNNTTYYYLVYPTLSSGRGADSNEIALKPLAAPTMTMAAGNGKVSLSWNAVPGANGYSLYRSTTAGTYGAALANLGAVTNYSDKAITNGTTYYYVLKATGASALSAASNEVSALPTVGTNHAPTVSVTGAPLSYSTGPNATRTIVVTYHDDDGAADVDTGILLVNFTPSIQRGLAVRYNKTQGTLSIINDGGSAWSSGTSPGAATTLSNSFGSLDCGQSTVTTTATDIVVSYVVTVFATLDGPNIVSARVSDAQGASPGNALLFGTWTVSGAAPQAVVPSPVLSLQSAAGQEQTVTLTFRDPDGGHSIQGASVLVNDRVNGLDGLYFSYNVQANQFSIRNEANTGWLASGTVGSSTILSNGFGSLNCATSTATLSGTDLVLTLKITPSFSLAGANSIYGLANDRGGRGNTWIPLGTWQITTAAPTLSGVAGDAQTTLSWTLVAGATGYNVLRSPVAEGPSALLTTTALGASTMTYTNTGLSNGTPSYYVVYAVFGMGGVRRGSNSNELALTPLARPAAPDLSISAGNALVTLTWAAVPDGTSYQVYKSTALDNFPATALATTTATTYTDTGVVNGTTYYYYARASGPGGESAASNTVSVMPFTTTVTPDLVPTFTPEPTPTFTPEPMSTSTPEPIPTVTPQPTPTFTPEPIPTLTTEPSPTFTPEPTSTATPEPIMTPIPVSTQSSRAVFWGDSITAGGVGSFAGATNPASSYAQQNQGPGFAQLAAVLAGNRIRLVHNAGVPGNTTSQILARWKTDVLPYRPDVICLLAGTNDISSTRGITLDQSKANISACIDLIRSINAVPVMCTIPPKMTSPTITASNIMHLMSLNTWIREYAATNNISLVDFYPLLVDPATNAYKCRYTLDLKIAPSGDFTLRVATRSIQGTREAWLTTNAQVNAVTTPLDYNTTSSILASALDSAVGKTGSWTVTGSAGGPFTIRSTSGYPFDITVETNTLAGGTGTATVTLDEALSRDGIHPSGMGEKLMGQAMAAAIDSGFPLNPPPLATLNTTNNCLRNGCFTIDNNGDGVPDFWGLSTGTFAYKLIPGMGAEGNWLRATRLTSGSLIAQQKVLAGTYNPGDVLAFCGRIRTSAFEASASNAMPWVAATKLYSVGLEINSAGSRWRPIDGWSYDIGDGWFYVETVVPEGTTSINAVVYATGGVVDMAQLSVVNLTQQGLVAP